MFYAKNMMCAADPRYERYLATTWLSRGHMTLMKVDEQMLNVRNKD